MARTGRPPKPSALRLLDGNRGHRAIPAEPPAPLGEMVPPDHLGAPAREVFEEVARWLEQRRLASPAYSIHLEVFAESVAAYRAAARLLAEHGPVVAGARGGEAVSSPAAREVARFARLVHEFGSDLGMSPTASARLARGDQRWADPDRPDPERLLT